MAGSNFHKMPWDQTQIKLEIVLIHENVPSWTGPVSLNKMELVPVRWDQSFGIVSNCKNKYDTVSTTAHISMDFDTKAT